LRYVLAVWALSGILLAQAASTKPASQCGKARTSLEAIIVEENQTSVKQAAEKADLEKRNKELADMNAGLLKQMDQVNAQYQRTLARYNDLIVKFNASIGNSNASDSRSAIAAQQADSDAAEMREATRRALAAHESLAIQQAQALRAQRAVAILGACPSIQP
jgi:hypothetical protein